MEATLAAVLALRIDFGDVPTWLSAFGGLASLAFAAVAAVAAWRLLRTEWQRDEKAAEVERRSQAGLVAAWFPDPGDREGYGPAAITVNVRNGSTLPIYRVLVFVMTRSADGGFEEIANSGGPDGTYRELAIPGDNEFVLEVPGAAGRRRVGVSFRDTMGATWRRDHDGSLTEIGKDERS